MKNMARKILVKSALVFLSVAVTLAATEIGVRVLGLAPSSNRKEADPLQSVLQFDSKLETRYQPNSHATIRSQYGEFAIEYDFNELGLRDRPVLSRSDDSDFRILALGNSFVEGWGVPVDECFVRVAEDKLNSTRPKSRRHYRVINAGASGYGAAQSYLLGKELMSTLRPDALVFFYLPTMLPADHKFIERAELDDDRLASGLNLAPIIDAPHTESVAVRSDSDRMLSFLTKWSSLAQLIRTRLDNRAAQRSIVPGDVQTDLFAAYRASSDALESMHAPTFRHIAAMAKMAHEAGIPFVVVQLPLPIEVSSVEWDRGRAIYGLSTEVANRPELHEFPAAALAKTGTPFLRARDFIASKAASSQGDPRIFFAYDFHLNRRGQQLLGEWLADNLSEAFR
jgi:lysophospholipase L1-like esterase